MRTALFKVVAVALGAALLSSLAGGCVWSRTRMNDPAIVSRARAIKPGVTKVGDLPRILGAQPTRRRTEGATTVYEYSYSDAKHEGLMLLVVNLSRTESVTETLYVEADAQTGVVTRVPGLTQREPDWDFWPFGDAGR